MVIMKHRYWVLIFTLYFILILPLGETESIGTTELLGLLILIGVYQIDRRLEHHKREPYIIEKSMKIEYLTPKELEERSRRREKA